MKCLELENHALDYLDGTLPGADRTALETHLASCAACAVRLREFSSGFGDIQVMLDSWPSLSPSRSFDSDVLAKVAAEAESPMVWWKQFLAPLFAALSKPAFAGTFSALLLAALVLVRFFPIANNSGIIASPPATPAVVALDSGDEIALVQSLNDLDDMELLRNFEVLQEMRGATP